MLKNVLEVWVVFCFFVSDDECLFFFCSYLCNVFWWLVICVFYGLGFIVEVYVCLMLLYIFFGCLYFLELVGLEGVMCLCWLFKVSVRFIGLFGISFLGCDWCFVCDVWVWMFRFMIWIFFYVYVEVLWVIVLCSLYLMIWFELLMYSIVLYCNIVSIYMV